MKYTYIKMCSAWALALDFRGIGSPPLFDWGLSFGGGWRWARPPGLRLVHLPTPVLLRSYLAGWHAQRTDHAEPWKLPHLAGPSLRKPGQAEREAATVCYGPCLTIRAPPLAHGPRRPALQAWRIASTSGLDCLLSTKNMFACVACMLPG